MSELLPCPFCNTKLRYVESWARSFQPNRLFIEIHHDDNDCPIGTPSWGWEDEPGKLEDFTARWNRRATPKDASTQPVGEEREWELNALLNRAYNAAFAWGAASVHGIPAVTYGNAWFDAKDALLKVALATQATATQETT